MECRSVGVTISVMQNENETRARFINSFLQIIIRGCTIANLKTLERSNSLIWNAMYRTDVVNSLITHRIQR
jgi:hypothetical protein